MCFFTGIQTDMKRLWRVRGVIIFWMALTISHLFLIVLQVTIRVTLAGTTQMTLISTEIFPLDSPNELILIVSQKCWQWCGGFGNFPSFCQLIFTAVRWWPITLSTILWVGETEWPHLRQMIKFSKSWPESILRWVWNCFVFFEVIGWWVNDGFF